MHEQAHVFAPSFSSQLRTETKAISAHGHNDALLDRANVLVGQCSSTRFQRPIGPCRSLDNIDNEPETRRTTTTTTTTTRMATVQSSRERSATDCLQRNEHARQHHSYCNLSRLHGAAVGRRTTSSDVTQRWTPFRLSLAFDSVVPIGGRVVDDCR
jgi:hypothetical protein